MLNCKRQRQCSMEGAGCWGSPVPRNGLVVDESKGIFHYPLEEAAAAHPPEDLTGWFHSSSSLPSPFPTSQGWASPSVLSQLESEINGKNTNSKNTPSPHIPVPLSPKVCHMITANRLPPPVTVPLPSCLLQHQKFLHSFYFFFLLLGFNPLDMLTLGRDIVGSLMAH